MSCCLITDTAAASTQPSAERKGSWTSQRRLFRVPPPRSSSGVVGELGQEPDSTVKQLSYPIKARYDRGGADDRITLDASDLKLTCQSLCN